MRRTSRTSYLARPRESIFTQADASRIAHDDSATTSPFLVDCVQAMHDCGVEARVAEQHLAHATADLTRVCTVLNNHKVYHLVSERLVQQYKEDIADEIEPTIKELISRAEKDLQALHKEAQRLEAKLHAQQSRGPSKATTATASSRTYGQGNGARRLHPSSRAEETAVKTEIRRQRGLVKHRERLEAELQELEAELKKLEVE